MIFTKTNQSNKDLANDEVESVKKASNTGHISLNWYIYIYLCIILFS